MGAPGAGTSALLTALMREQAAASGALRGQERVTQPQALALPQTPDTLLIDLPGLRELGVWKPDLAGGFREFGPYVGLCNRPGCLHRQGPGCAVRQAAEAGQMDRRPYERYVQLLHHLRLA